MDTNSYRDGNGEVLDEATKELIERREKYMGGAYRLFYRKPVNLVRGQGEYLWDAEGTQYLDMYNNVAGVGHCNPAVVDAVDEQMKLLNTHTRYLHTRIVDYSEEILAMLPKEIDKIMYMCTGSEANDLALRVAWEYTGGKGIIISQEAYHGTSALTSGCSPALGSEQPLLPYVEKGEFGPAERAYGYRPTGIGTVLKKSNVTVVTWSLGELYQQYGYQDHKYILTDLLDCLCPTARVIHTDAHPSVELFWDGCGEDMLLQA